MKTSKAILMLEDGTVFEGISIGAPGERIGEVVLNTAVVGYQEMMTDPANAGKILVLTYPLIGNYGVAKKFNESKKAWVWALIIKEKSNIVSNWQAEGPLDEFLKKEDVVSISEVDTRTLTVSIRENGEMLGIVTTKNRDHKKLHEMLKEYKARPKRDRVKDISVKRTKEIKGAIQGKKISVIDLGVTNGYLAQLKNLGCNVTLFPYDTDADKVLKSKPDGVIVSNGPEDDAALPGVINEVKKLIGKVPLFGISTGHQVIACALGGTLKKMKVGHRGVNYPVRSDNLFKGDITVQNHSFVVDATSLKGKEGVAITLFNVNDNTVEEIVSLPKKILSVQYCPVSPGFNEVHEAFKRFLAMIAGSNQKPVTSYQKREKESSFGRI